MPLTNQDRSPIKTAHQSSLMSICRRHFAKMLMTGMLGNALNLRGAQSAIADQTYRDQTWGDQTWSYDGERGPQHWGDLSPNYQLCANGTHQSPIDLAGLSPSTVHWQTHYQPSPLKLTNMGHTLQADYAAGSHLIIESQAFNLLQFHFHDPSEHTRHRQHQPLEIHFVHQHAETQALAVLSVLVTAGPAHPTLEVLVQSLPHTLNQTIEPPHQRISAANLLPQDRSPIFQYSGSLTTPPCSENVTWLVLGQPITATPAQIKKITALMGQNARPVQPFP